MSTSSKSKMENVEVAPLRTLEDFLSNSARFQVPNVKDPEKWANRVTNNLLYYQTNYFVGSLIIFLIVGVLHPVQMLFGIVSVALAFGLFVYVSNNQAPLRRFKRQHPGASLVLVLLGGYALIYLFGSIIVFLFGIAMPLMLVIIHSSLRLRNLKNKISNKIEFVGLKRTPMGLLLESLGLESEAGS